MSKEIEYFIEDLEENYREKNYLLNKIKSLEENIKKNYEEIDRYKERLFKVCTRIEYMEIEKTNVESRSIKSF